MNQNMEIHNLLQINLYGNDPWKLTEVLPCPEAAKAKASVFALSNGHIGLRGGFEEDCRIKTPDGTNDLFINGVYGSEPIKYAEVAFGYAKERQTMLTFANPLGLEIQIDGERFSACSNLKNYRRTLDLKTGLLIREGEWTLKNGTQVSFAFERFVSLEDDNLICSRYSFESSVPIDEIRLHSFISEQYREAEDSEDSRAATVMNGMVSTVAQGASENTTWIIQGVKCPEQTVCITNANMSKELVLEESNYSIIASGGGNNRYVLERVSAVLESQVEETDKILSSTLSATKKAMNKGFEILLSEQKNHMDSFWEDSDIAVSGSPIVQQIVRFACYELYCNAGHNEKTSLPAKGLTGSGYDGHYFWDTETYMFPFFAYTQPERARKLLMYRYGKLDAARKRALELGYENCALYPWRTINGEECSPYYPAGTAQYHINADIAYAVITYYRVTQDKEFLFRYGAEILAETARFWMKIGFFNPNRDGKFCINCVTGPDEYTALVNNNCYTNLMAASNLKYAAEALREFEQELPEEYIKFSARRNIYPEERNSWEKASENIYLPYDEQKGIYLQDDQQLDRIPWEMEQIPRENFPLLLHYHPLTIYRHLICKQADLVLAMVLNGDNFTFTDKEKALDFYETITTHDSSLSRMIFCILACNTQKYNKADKYFAQGSACDIHDVQGNTTDGLHMANLGGVWMGLIYGYAGMRIQDDALSFTPHCPSFLDSFSFRIKFGESKIRVEIRKNETFFSLVSGPEVKIIVSDKSIFLRSSDLSRA